MPRTKRRIPTDPELSDLIGRTCRASGVPVHLTDATAVASVVSLLRPQ